MVRGNHIISNTHFHKNWQSYLKTWFNQPLKKKRRLRRRNKKAVNVAPRPLKAPLRPVVNCPSFRYNRKVRIGRGFSLEELKKAKLNSKFARSVGIAVDHRRRNKSYESLGKNVQRLKEYMQKLILYPKGEKKCQKDEKECEKGIHKLEVLYVMPVKKKKELKQKVKGKTVTEEDKKFSAYQTLRKERKAVKKKVRRDGKKKKKKEEKEG